MRLQIINLAPKVAYVARHESDVLLEREHCSVEPSHLRHQVTRGRIIPVQPHFLFVEFLVHRHVQVIHNILVLPEARREDRDVEREGDRARTVNVNVTHTVGSGALSCGRVL